MNNGDMPAVAITIPMSDIGKQQAAASGWPQEPTIHLGLTKREHFAGLATVPVEVLIEALKEHHPDGFNVANYMEFAVRYKLEEADLLLAALEKS